jgi:hypothetical protein
MLGGGPDQVDLDLEEPEPCAPTTRDDCAGANPPVHSNPLHPSGREEQGSKEKKTNNKENKAKKSRRNSKGVTRESPHVTHTPFPGGGAMSVNGGEHDASGQLGFSAINAGQGDGYSSMSGDDGNDHPPPTIPRLRKSHSDQSSASQWGGEEDLFTDSAAAALAAGEQPLSRSMWDGSINVGNSPRSGGCRAKDDLLLRSELGGGKRRCLRQRWCKRRFWCCSRRRRVSLACRSLAALIAAVAGLLVYQYLDLLPLLDCSKPGAKCFVTEFVELHNLTTSEVSST